MMSASILKFTPRAGSSNRPGDRSPAPGPVTEFDDTKLDLHGAAIGILVALALSLFFWIPLIVAYFR